MTSHKVGFKARSGRHRRSPEPHPDHRKRPSYSRAARILKARVALMLAPRAEDFEDLERPRLGMSDRQVALALAPSSSDFTYGGSGAAAPCPMTHQEATR